VTVTPPGAGDFTINASPLTRQVNGTRTVSYTITVASTNGFSGAVDLAIAVSDTNHVTAAATPTAMSLTSGGSTTATLGASASAPGTYTITVTATSGGLSHPETVTLRRK
jgi:hypothetical protein